MDLRKVREVTQRSCEEGALGQGRYWIIAKRGDGHIQLLTTALDGSGEALPVFGFEEEAEMFLWLEGRIGARFFEPPGAPISAKAQGRYPLL
jgi:hypothetical protein